MESSFSEVDEYSLLESMLVSSVAEFILLPFLALVDLVGWVAVPVVFGLVPVEVPAVDVDVDVAVDEVDGGGAIPLSKSRPRALLSGVGLVTVFAVVGLGGIGWFRNVSSLLLLSRIFGRFCRENGHHRFFIDLGLISTSFGVVIRSWVW